MDPVEVHEQRVATTSHEYSTGGSTAATPARSDSTYTSTTGVYPAGGRVTQAIWFVVGVMNVFLAGDFIFHLLAAHKVGFAQFVYAIGGGLAAPFDGIFNISIQDGVYVVKWSDLLAIAVYSLVAWGIVKLVGISTSRGSTARTA